MNAIQCAYCPWPAQWAIQIVGGSVSTLLVSHGDHGSIKVCNDRDCKRRAYAELEHQMKEARAARLAARGQ